MAKVTLHEESNAVGAHALSECGEAQLWGDVPISVEIRGAGVAG